MKDMPEYGNMRRLDRYNNRLTEWCTNRSLIGNAADFLRKLFVYDPDKRLTARQALDHAWFNEAPLPTRE